MIAIFYLVLQLLKLYSYVVIANVIISWLIAFNILNTQSRFVFLILDFTYRLTEPFLRRIRRFLPNLGALDISPIILVLLIWLSTFLIQVPLHNALSKEKNTEKLSKLIFSNWIRTILWTSRSILMILFLAFAMNLI